MSSGRYGKNQWKIILYSFLAVGFAVLVVGVGVIGLFLYAKPKDDGYQNSNAGSGVQGFDVAELDQTVDMTQVVQDNIEQPDEAVEEYAPEQATYASEYEVVVSDATWLEAKAYAEERGGHLVVITSSEEQEYVQGLVNQYDTLHTVWLGGMFINGEFQWINDESFLYTKWGVGEPNNETGDEIYLDMYEKDDVWVWNDVPNDIKQYYSGKMGFVIEWEVAQ